MVNVSNDLGNLLTRGFVGTSTFLECIQRELSIFWINKKKEENEIENKRKREKENKNDMCGANGHISHM